MYFVIHTHWTILINHTAECIAFINYQLLSFNFLFIYFEFHFLACTLYSHAFYLYWDSQPRSINGLDIFGLFISITWNWCPCRHVDICYRHLPHCIYVVTMVTVLFFPKHRPSDASPSLDQGVLTPVSP